MKKKIVVQNASSHASQKSPVDRKERLAKELRENLHKRKAQARENRALNKKGKDNNG